MIPSFTAFQIARALGISPQAVRKAVGKSPAVVIQPCEETGFQEARSWTLENLPDSMRARLVRLATGGGFRSVHHLLSGDDTKFSCSIPLEDFDPPALQRAVNLKAHLAPILRQAEEISIHEMSRRAHLSIARGGEARLESPRTLRYRIERILRRAGGRADFDNLEIYAEEFAKPRADADPVVRPSLSCPNISLALQEFSSLEQDASFARIFEAAGDDYRELSKGSGQRRAKAAVLDALAASGLQLSASRDALRKKLNVVFSRMDSGLVGESLINPPTLKSRGRKPLATLNEEEIDIARRFFVKTESVTLSLRMLAESPDCRQEIADAILKRRRSKHTITPTLRAQVADVPPAVRGWYKSPTKIKRESFINPRTLTYLDEGGTEERILPGMLCERDDMSNNFIFWIDWPWGGDPCSDKYGVRIARGQNLLHLDAGSLRFLSYLMLVRLRDSYRADDIWQWVGQTYRDIGIPQIGERWERGIWKANKLHGLPIEEGHTDQVTRLGGISALGRKIIVSQSPTTKIIENRFRFFQRVCTTIPGQIGASRGEMDKVNKLWTQCREGRRDPRDYFLKYEDVCQQLESKLQYVNAEAVEGAIYQGIPNDIWLSEGGDERMTRLAPEQAYLFSRDRTIVTVNKGHALVRKSSPSGQRLAWYFHHPDLWRHDGQQVALYFDKYAPAAGATIVHADRKRVNEVIGHAALVDGCPQFALGLDFENRRGSEAAVNGLARRGDFLDAVRAEYRALGLTHTIARGTYVTDGAGKSAQVERQENGQGVDSFRRDKAEEILTRSRRELEEVDLDKLENMERQAFEMGDFLPQ